mgnify:CR=1 FL=1
MSVRLLARAENCLPSSTVILRIFQNAGPKIPFYTSSTAYGNFFFGTVVYKWSILALFFLILLLI